jgi:hypothetical protein
MYIKDFKPVRVSGLTRLVQCRDHGKKKVWLFWREENEGHSLEQQTLFPALRMPFILLPTSSQLCLKASSFS